LGVLVHPEYATETQELYVDMNTTFESGSNLHDYGRSIVYDGSGGNKIEYASALKLQKSKVVFAINTAAYYAFYVKLMTGPVPVRFNCAPHDFDDD
jgi:hypothetical protein